MKCVVKSVGAAFVIFAFGGSLTYAGEITGVQPGGDFNLTGVTPPPPPNPNNDDAGGASNVIGATKVFKNNGPMDHVFTVRNSGGITEYMFLETVVNMTGVDWNDFHFQLGFGTGAAFQLSGQNDGLDFDTPSMVPKPTSSKFAALAHGANALTWTTGLVKNGASVDFGFSIDVPDNTDIPADFRVGNGYSFTLREQPSLVPEPDAVGLFGIGALMVFGYVRRTRRGKSNVVRAVARA